MAIPDLLQCGEGAHADLLDRPLARDLPVARRARVALRRPFRIVVDKGPGLLLVDLEPLCHRFLLVVLALEEGLAGQIVLARNFRRIEGEMVVASRGRVHAPPAQTPDDLLVIDVDLEHEIEIDARVAQRLRLRNCARKAVEQVTVPAIQVLQPLLHQSDDDVVGNEPPRVHDLLCRKTERRARFYRGAQHVSRRDLRNAEAIPNEGRLGALTGARRSQEDQSHYCPRRLRPGSYPTRRTYRL